MELIRQAGLSPGAIANITRQLRRNGFIREARELNIVQGSPGGNGILAGGALLASRDSFETAV